MGLKAERARPLGFQARKQAVTGGLFAG